MPASQLSQQSPADVLQLCGVKRKAESCTETDFLSQPPYEQDPGPKRICLCPEEGFDSVGNLSLLNEHDQTEISFDVSYAKRSQPGLEMNTDRTMTDDVEAMPQSGGSPSVGEVSSVADITKSQGTDSMEIDYGAEHETLYQQTSSIQEAPAQMNQQICEDYCGFGSASPTSGLLRCYCRPSWEGLVEMQHYRSDYY